MLYIDGQLLVDDDGLHGMVERCGVLSLASSVHGIYLVGFQAGGGVGMELRYSGPDTAGKKLFVLPGAVPSTSLMQEGTLLALSAKSTDHQQNQASLLHSIFTLRNRLKVQVLPNTVISPILSNCFGEIICTGIQQKCFHIFSSEAICTLFVFFQVKLSLNIM